jgi:hypothetical protein
MGVLDRVLALRPSNGVTRLGTQSRVPLLNPADLVRALGPATGALLSVPVSARFALPGLLRASRDCDAPIGLRCPSPLAGRDSPAGFFEAVRVAAEELRLRRPIFLEAGPIRVPSVDDRALARATAEAYAFVDAGFAALSLDASGLDIDDAAEAYRQVAQPAAERELSVEVAAPLEGGRASAGALTELLEALRSLAVAVQFVRVESRALGVEGTRGTEWALDTPLLEGLHRAASQHGAATCVEERAPLSARWASAWVAAGVRKVIPLETFEQIASAREAPQLRERVEALWYSEAAELFAAVGSGGAGSRTMGFLARGDGD